MRIDILINVPVRDAYRAYMGATLKSMDGLISIYTHYNGQLPGFENANMSIEIVPPLDYILATTVWCMPRNNIKGQNLGIDTNDQNSGLRHYDGNACKIHVHIRKFSYKKRSRGRNPDFATIYTLDKLGLNNNVFGLGA